MDEISGRVVKRNLKDKDEMLKNLQAMVKFVYDNNLVPCFELAFVLRNIQCIYKLTANYSKLQKNITKK